MEYRLAGFKNVQTKQGIKVSEIWDEIMPNNQICTLEQAKVCMKAVESFMKEMKNQKVQGIMILCIGHIIRNM